MTPRLFTPYTWQQLKLTAQTTNKLFLIKLNWPQKFFVYQTQTNWAAAAAMLLYLQFLIIFDAFPSLYYSIICRRLSHGRKLSLAGEQANLCRERQREEREGGLGSGQFGRACQKFWPSSRLGSGHDSQINKQLLLVEHVATSSRSPAPLSLLHSRTVHSCDKDFSTATAAKTF